MFQNFIFRYIIDFIVFQKLNGQIYKFKSSKYNNNNINNNEMINYSLVSKKWFRLLQLSLESNISYMNYDFLKSFMVNKKSNSQFKIIRRPSIKVFNSYLAYHEYISSVKTSSTASVKEDVLEELTVKDIDNNSINDGSSDNIDSISSCYNEGITYDEEEKILINFEQPLEEFNPYKEIDKDFSFGDNVEFNFKIQLNDSKENILKIKDLKLNKIMLNGNRDSSSENITYKRFKVIENLQPKRIEYSQIDPTRSSGVGALYHIDYSELFEVKGLESIDILGLDHVNPKDFNINNQTTSLKFISIPIYFHDIIRAINSVQLPADIPKQTCRSFCINTEFPLELRDRVKEDFSRLINLLSSNKTIKSLMLVNYCIRGGCDISGLDCTFVTSSIKSLLLNNSTIREFGFYYLDFIDENMISAFCESKTIKTLLIASNENLVINTTKLILEKVLPFNSNIRVLKLYLDWSTIEELDRVVELLKENSNNIQLYSLVFLFRKFKIDSNIKMDHYTIIKRFTDKLLNLYLNINEINIYSLINESKIQFQILNNKLFTY